MWQEMMKEEAKEEEIERLFMGVMGGYKDACMPPLMDFSAPEKLFSAMNEMGSSSSNGKRQRKEGPVATPSNGIIYKERKRRGKMAEMYSVLQSLVPSISNIHKATREKIVAESTDYIKRLEEEILRLENLKKSLLGELVVYKPTLSQCRNTVSSVNVTVSKGLAFFGIQFQLTQGLITKIFSVLDKHQAEILAANISDTSTVQAGSFSFNHWIISEDSPVSGSLTSGPTDPTMTLVKPIDTYMYALEYGLCFCAVVGAFSIEFRVCNDQVTLIISNDASS
ncbi:hypothetical protein HAX54_005460 [Datura stramonium]|uniref:BHLH domain-containing protein n=1 Tax=Datura stramonium TaxID=4076 RepID=A0ABS8T9I9_DATST|nr:hypothetical protein [Datura stramonium]